MAHHQENFHEQLESNDKEVVEELKKTIREQFVKGGYFLQEHMNVASF